MTESPLRGIVIARHRREAVIEDRHRDILRALVRGRKLHPLTGDDVVYSIEHDGTAVIQKILPRSSVLERINSRGKTEGIAANISLIAIVVAPVPAPDWRLVDRYIVAAELIGVGAALIRNKADIADQALDDRVQSYQQLGYPVVTTSTRQSTGIDELKRLIAGQRGVLVGQSGAGKSSLINSLLDRDAQATGALSEGSKLGRHTTTASMLFRTPGEGELIDSPGVRRYAPDIPDQASLAYGFVEFRPWIDRCRFADCRHLEEPDCAVVAALKSGEIPTERYESYRSIVGTLLT